MAVGGVVVPFLLGYLTMLLFRAPQIVALCVGTAMVATSVDGGASWTELELDSLKTRVSDMQKQIQEIEARL